MASGGSSGWRVGWRGRSSRCALVSTAVRLSRRRWWGCWRIVQLLLFIPQEVDNKLLVLLDEVVGQSLVLEVLAKMLAPQGIKGIQHGELRGCFPTIEASRRIDDVVLDGVGVRSGRL